MIFEIEQKLREIAFAIKKVKNTNEIIPPIRFPEHIEKMAYIDGGTVTGPVDRVTSGEPSISVDVNTGKAIANISYESGYIDAGTKSVEAQLPTQEAQTITPSTTDQTISKGKILIGDQVIQGDSNLISENIIRGRGNGNYIFGVRGIADKVVDFNYNKPVWSGAYANQVVNVARSYWDARVSGRATFTYNQTSLFEGYVTDQNGAYRIDCSTYLSLVLRGIDYKHSPYFGKTGANITIDASTIKPLTVYDWTYDTLNKQPTDISSNGNIRNAANIAEFFYLQGRLIPEDEVMPGDLTFYAAKYDDGTYHINNRFKNVSHIGIVAEEKYIQRDSNGKVTSYEFYNVTTVTGVVIRSKSSARNDFIFAVRPDYTPKTEVSEISDINLMPIEYHSGGVGTTIINEMSFNVKLDGSIVTSGQPTTGTTFYLSSKSYPRYLKKGTYLLSGCPSREDVTSGLTWGLIIKKTDGTQIAWDLGNGVTFEVTDDFIDVYMCIYVSSSLDSTGYTWNPKLIRIG